jgi:hypothetical protein|tara:strand:+ start:175 stop:420 length:246 start_codon:yes stop_codon:yes gene_type:complete
MLCCILNIKDLNNVPYKHYNIKNMQVFQDDAETVQTNIDNTEFIISFLDNNIPEITEGKTIYTQKELEDIIDDPANGWVEQ